MSPGRAWTILSYLNLPAESFFKLSIQSLNLRMARHRRVLLNKRSLRIRGGGKTELRDCFSNPEKFLAVNVQYAINDKPPMQRASMTPNCHFLTRIKKVDLMDYAPPSSSPYSPPPRIFRSVAHAHSHSTFAPCA